MRRIVLQFFVLSFLHLTAQAQPAGVVLDTLHIKHIDFKLYNNTNAPSSSSISFDMYWMKHDYKYSE